MGSSSSEMGCLSKCCLGCLFLVIFLPFMALGIAIVACAPFLNTAMVLLCLTIYFIVRFIEFASGDDSYTDYFSPAGDSLANSIIYGSLMNIFCGWDIWLVIVYKVHALKHHVVLELELHKWVLLLLIFSALCIPMMAPRLILAAIRDDIDHRRDLVHLIDGIVAAIECVVFIRAELAVMKHAPHWKYHHAFGFQTWKLIQVLALILFGIMVINVSTRLLIYLLQIAFGNRKRVVYFAKGMRKSANFVCISNLLMAMWVSYFEPHFRRKALWSSRALDFVTWAFVCLAIGSVFWLIKKWIVLLWKAHAVYDRFQDKIMQAGIQFYFLSILGYNKAFDKEGISDHGSGSNNVWFNFHKKVLRSGMMSAVQTTGAGGNEQNRQKAKGILVQLKRASLPTYELQRMTKYFQDIDEAALPDQDSIVSSLFKIEDQTDSSNSEPKKIVTWEQLQKSIKMKLNTEDAGVLYEQIDNVDSNKDSTEGIDAQKIEKWVEKAYRNCWELGNTILGATEVANYLNKLLTGFLLLMIIIIWLLVTKIATIELFILIISPVLAASFIFGDTCKSIFQGIIFAFVMHLFDVGDVCVINGNQLEVKRIGIWKTTFMKVGTDEKMIYQNSILADKVITKHKGGLGSNDTVEYYIPIATWNPSIFCELKTHIDEYLEKSAEFKKHPLGVLVKEVGDNVKIAIHFKHEAGLQDMIYSECHRKQSRNRAKLLLKVKKFLDGKESQKS